MHLVSPGPEGSHLAAAFESPKLLDSKAYSLAQSCVGSTIGLAQGTLLFGLIHLACLFTSGRGFQSRTTGSMPLVARKQ